MPLPGTFHNYFYAAFRDTFCNSFCTTFPATFSNLPCISSRSPSSKTLQVPNTKTNLGDSQVADPRSPPKPPSIPHSEAACLPHAFDTGGTSLPVSLSPRSPQPQPPQLRRRKRTPLSPHPYRPFFPAPPALTCRSEGRGAPRGQARVPVVSGEDRTARGRPTEDPRLSRARRGLAAGERWQPAAVLLSAEARGQARPSAPRRRRAPCSA